ncbi:MAG: hypothetical protein KA144_04295 [Xanthomonadaceae bacterium]|nr:hypothetical protein [Xanthomonadaceae bacterium]
MPIADDRSVREQDHDRSPHRVVGRIGEPADGRSVRMHPRRRAPAWAISMTLLLVALTSAQARAVTLIDIDISTKGAPVEARIEVSANGENRIVFSSLRSTVQWAKVETIHPDGRVVREDRGAALKLLAEEEAMHPERGAVYRLHEIVGAAPGVWRIRITPERGGRGRIRGAASLRPRYELMLPIVMSEWRAGELAVVQVLANDNGMALAGIPGIRFWIEDMRGRKVHEGVARTGLRNRYGVLLNPDTRVYLATPTLTKAGRYRVFAVHDFGDGPVRTSTEIVVR